MSMRPPEDPEFVKDDAPARHGQQREDGKHGRGDGRGAGEQVDERAGVRAACRRTTRALSLQQQGKVRTSKRAQSRPSASSNLRRWDSAPGAKARGLRKCAEL